MTQGMPEWHKGCQNDTRGCQNGTRIYPSSVAAAPCHLPPTGKVKIGICTSSLPEGKDKILRLRLRMTINMDGKK